MKYKNEGQQAQHLIEELLPQVMAQNPNLRYGDVAVLYPAAWIGNHVAEAAMQAGISAVRTDGNALYPRGSRLMQWLEHCSEWCCGGWRTGVPRFSRLVSEGHRLFAESIRSEDHATAFHRQLITVLWSARDADLQLHPWLEDLKGCIIAPLSEGCVALRDELETLSTFSDRTSPTGDCADTRHPQAVTQHVS